MGDFSYIAREKSPPVDDKALDRAHELVDRTLERLEVLVTVAGLPPTTTPRIINARAALRAVQKWLEIIPAEGVDYDARTSALKLAEEAREDLAALRLILWHVKTDAHAHVDCVAMCVREFIEICTTQMPIVPA